MKTCGRYWRRRYWRGRFWRRYPINFCSGKIPFNIKCGKIALTISLHNLTKFLITKIRINNFVTQLDEIPYWRVKTEERRRRFQKSLRKIQDTISLHNFTKFRIIQFRCTISLHNLTKFSLHNLTKFRVIQISHRTIWRVSQTWRRRNQFRKRRNQLSVLSKVLNLISFSPIFINFRIHFDGFGLLT